MGKGANHTDPNPLLVIVGPTAVGKTEVSLHLAETFNGEIVSADSRLFYRSLDIGTDKPSSTEQLRVPHHLIDICLPDETITLGQYKRLAEIAIVDIQRRGQLPILVGGTGQYVRAIIEGWGIPEVAPQEHLRVELAKLGNQEAERWLRCLDPSTAERIDNRNIRRMIRALEVTLVTGRKMSELQGKVPPAYAVKKIGLTCERTELYRRIDERVDRMIATGFVQEVEKLRLAGYNRNLPSMSGLGYRQLWSFLEGECTLSEAIERIKYETHRFARQQYAWFRPGKSDVSWFDVLQEDWRDQIVRVVRDWLFGISYYLKNGKMA